MYIVPHRMPAPSAARIPMRGFAGRGLMRGRDGEQRRARKHAERAADDAEPALPSGVVQLVEEKISPENSEQAVGVPQGKCNAEADVADGVNGERVGDSPHASGEDGPDDEVRRLTNVGVEMRGAANERGHTPAGEENSANHNQRDGDR